eukprot:1504439-Rhodomonas_salina.2
MTGAAAALASFGVENVADLERLDEQAVGALVSQHGLSGLDATKLRSCLKSKPVRSIIRSGLWCEDVGLCC